MKILLASAIPPPAGGIAFWTNQYLRYMNEHDISVDLLNVGVTGKRVSNYTKKSVPEEAVRFFKILLKTFLYAVSGEYTLAHINTSCSKSGILRDKVILDILYFFKIKIILQCHCNVDYALKNKRSYRIFKKMLNKTKKCLVLNQNSQKFIMENFDIEPQVVPNFISEEYKTAIYEPKSISEEVKIALFVGHILDTKGCDIIIKAAYEYPSIEFRLVGHISSKYQNMVLPPNVILTNEKTAQEVREEYKRADLLLFPTHTEGFPLTIIEAMAYGLPIITTEVGAIPDILEEQGAFYIPVNSLPAIVEAISKAKDSEVRREMSDFNRRKVKNYIVDKVLKQLINDVYME